MSDARDRWSAFLSAPIGEVAARVMHERWIGRRFGTYEVVAALGAGGMGEVYRARDTRLGRDVAIKVLSAAFVADRERLARFEREARVLAALNHPHIAAIYGVEDVEGATVLVLELVDGQTLADQIARGPLLWREALPIARQVCEALEAAHEKGIIHRDLKPSNIALMRDGAVKVLDFGLAKATEAVAADGSQSPTLTVTGAGDGVLLGTAAYMSPEQARGQVVDKRTDIWAFGCVLFEMLTGRVAFPGATVSDHIAAILEREPDWLALPATAPVTVQRLVRRCLAKDPKLRLHDIADARVELDETDIAGKDQHQRRAERASFVWPAAVVGSAVIAAVVGWTVARSHSGSTTRGIIKTEIAMPSGAAFLDDNAAVALSPDGKTVVFAADTGRVQQLYLRSLDDLATTPIPGTDGAFAPCFSPNGQWVAFWANSQIKKVTLNGGAPQVVYTVQGLPGAQPGSLTWSDNGTIFFAADNTAGLTRVSADGGTPQTVTIPNRDQREKTHRWPDALPGGKAVLMTVGTADITSFDDARIEAVTVATGQRKVLLQGGTYARYVSTGHLVYARAGSLLSVPFDLNRLEVTGPPITVLRGAYTDPSNGEANVVVSRTGSLLYAAGGENASPRTLIWVDREGRAERVTDIRRPFVGPRLSPDGRRVLVVVDLANDEDWVYDLERTTFMRLAYGWDNRGPIWTPDGSQIVFNSTRPDLGSWNLFRRPSDGTGAAESLTTDARAPRLPLSFSPDGRTLVFGQRDPVTDWDLWMLSLDDHTVRPFVQTSAAEFGGRISPDGRWIAYASNQSGRFEVYIQAFPGPSRSWQVSLDGGVNPIWALNGREVFFRHDNEMMAAEVSSVSEFTASRPRRLFEGQFFGYGYDVARDGRFLMVAEEPRPATHLILVQNWAEELKQRVPSK